MNRAILIGKIVVLPTAALPGDLEALVLDAVAHFGDASTGQIAAWVAAPVADVDRALGALLAAGRVTILPGSLTWAGAAG